MRYGLWAIVLLLLTVFWLRGLWSHFRPPKGADFDWGMTHGFWLVLGGILILGMWIAQGRAIWLTIVSLLFGS
jgi:hypothetical protein